MAKEALGTSTRGNTERANKKDSHAFDLQSWQGLTEVLKVARESELEDEAYATFRDLVLQYAQSKGDTELKEKIDAYIRTFKSNGADAARNTKAQNAPQSTEAVAEETPRTPPAADRQTKEPTAQEQSVHATRRPTPIFSPKETDTSHASDQRSVPGSDSVSSHKEQIAHTQFVPENLPTEDRASKSSTKRTEASAQQEGSADSRTNPGIKAESRPDEAASVQKEQQKPVDHNVSASAEAPTSPEDIETHKARIAAIKKKVNSRVGNPITLIDSGNPIGRTYMNALLEAMKATAGGKRGALAEKMEALERAYTEVMQYLESRGGTIEEAPVKSSKPEPALEPEPEQSEPTADAPAASHTPDTEEVDTDPSKPEPETPTATKRSKQPEDAPESVQQPAIEPEPKARTQEAPRDPASVDASSEEIKAELETTIKEMPSAPTKKSETPKTPETPVPSIKTEQTKTDAEQPAKPAAHVPFQSKDAPRKLDQQETPSKEHEEAVAAPVTHTEQQPKQNLASHIEGDTQSAWNTAPGVRTDAYPNTTEEIKSISDMVDSVTASQSEINSNEVTKGLDQLLEQWDLFKRSGLLGMGPGGKEHPLYKQLSVLPMSEVVSGRWEGATRENIKILKDYINAWRNEQGITYNQNETFEHYLRRVVQRVLKRQNVSI